MLACALSYSVIIINMKPVVPKQQLSVTYNYNKIQHHRWVSHNQLACKSTTKPNSHHMSRYCKISNEEVKIDGYMLMRPLSHGSSISLCRSLWGFSLMPRG